MRKTHLSIQVTTPMQHMPVPPQLCRTHKHNAPKPATLITLNPASKAIHHRHRPTLTRCLLSHKSADIAVVNRDIAYLAQELSSLSLPSVSHDDSRPSIKPVHNEVAMLTRNDKMYGSYTQLKVFAPPEQLDVQIKTLNAKSRKVLTPNHFL